MLGKLRGTFAQLPRGLILWSFMCVLLAVGITTTVLDLVNLPTEETQRANFMHQRVIVDPATGVVSGISGEEPAEEFDVAEEEEPAEEPTETPAAEEQKEPPVAQAPAEETKPEEPVAESAEETTEAPIEAAPAPPVATEPPAEQKDAQGRSVLRTEALKPDLTAAAARGKSLVPAPAPEITEVKGRMKLPKRGLKDAAASRLYARNFARKEEHVLLSILIVDAGFSDESLGLLLELPPEVSVAMSPYGPSTSGHIPLLRKTGHEVWGMLPAQGARYPQDDPGPMGLLTSLSKDDAKDRLHQVLAATLGSVGMVLPVDETISTRPEPFGSVLGEINARGLYVVSTHPLRTVDQLSGNEKLRSIIRRADIVLDSTPGAAFIKSKLNGLNDAAKAQGELVVIASARPLTLKLLGEWLKDSKLDAAVTLAPVTALWQPKVPPPPPEPPEEKKAHGGGH